MTGPLITSSDLAALANAANHNCECNRAWTGRVTWPCGAHRLLQDSQRIAVLVAERRDARRLIAAEHDPRALPPTYDKEDH